MYELEVNGRFMVGKPQNIRSDDPELLSVAMGHIIRVGTSRKPRTRRFPVVTTRFPHILYSLQETREDLAVFLERG